MTKIEDAVWLYDRAVYDDAVASGIIEDKYLTDWMENPNLDIDTIAKKPVRFMLCALGVREWRDTMLWRRAYEEGITYSTPDLVTLSEMTDEALHDIFWHYCADSDKFADTAWGYHFQIEMLRRENKYA